MNFLKDLRTAFQHHESSLAAIPPSTSILQYLLFQSFHESVEVAAIVSDDGGGRFNDLHSLFM